MDSWLKLLYPNIQIPPSLLSASQPTNFAGALSPQSLLSSSQAIRSGLSDIQPSPDGASFGGGGVNYSTPVGDGQLDAKLKANLLRVQWQDKLNAIALSAGHIESGHNGVSVTYQRKF